MRETLRIYVPSFFVRRYTISVKRKSKRYKEIEKALVSARIPVTTQKFLAISKFYSYISFIIGSAIGLYLFYFCLSPEFLLYIAGKTPFYNTVLTHYLLIKKVFPFFGILVGVLSYKLIQYIILSYPFFVSSRRKSEIEMYLPHAISMMYGIAVGGMPVYEMIKTIAESKHVLGELSKEFSVMLEMIDVFKKDVFEAIRFVRDTTPSQKLSAFLDNLVYILQGGGKLSEFLKNKSEELAEERDIAFQSFTEFAGIMAEVYLAIFVLLPLFLLIVLVVMKMIGQDVLTLYRNVVLVVLPISAVVFTWVVKSAMPVAEVRLEKYEAMYGSKIKASTTDRVEESFSFSRRKKFFNSIRKFILHPFEENIHTIQFRIIAFHLTVLGIFVFVLVLAYGRLSFELTMILPLSAVIVPLVTLIEIRERKIRNVEDRIPDIFSELAGLNEAGLSIFEALRILSHTEMGILTKEISVLRREIEWGIAIPQAFIRFGLRLKSEILSKAIPVVIKALEVSPTIKDAFTVVAKYANSEVQFRKRLRSNMFLYVVIIYMSVGVFLFVEYSTIKNFLEVFSKMNVTASAVGGFFVPYNLDFIKEIFFQVNLIISIISGMIAGILGEGKALLGIKHSYIFSILTYIMFFHILSF